MADHTVPKLDSSKVQIAVAGHANSGKTSIVRTMTKKRIGRVSDKAGSSEYPEPILQETIQAYFIDCPGFQNANIMSRELRHSSKEQLLEKLESLFDDADLDHDARALSAIIRADAALYVASLATSPDRSHEQEILLVSSVQPNTVGLISKSFLLKEIDSVMKRNEFEGRVRFWSELFDKHKIPWVIFDSHFGSTQDLKKMNEMLLKKMNADRGDRFKQGLDNFSIEREKIRNQCSKHLAELIAQCAKRFEGNSEDDVRDQLKREIANLIITYLTNISRIYDQDAEYRPNPTLYGGTIDVKTSSRLDTIASHAAAGMGAGAALGASLGALIGIFGGPVGVAVGAALGAQIGGGVGAVAGGIVVGTAAYLETHKVIGQLQDSDIDNIFISCVAFTWAVSYHSYVFDDDLLDTSNKIDIDHIQKKIPATRAKDLQKEIDDYVKSGSWSSQYRVDWTSARMPSIETCCRIILEKFVS